MTDHAPSPVDAETVDGLVQLSFLMLGELGRIAAEHDLSLTGVRMLGILRDRRPPMLELGRRLDLGKSSITGLVGRAEKRDLVRRRPDEHDGRGFRVELTDAGRDLAATFTRAMTARVDELLADLGPCDRRALADLAWRVIQVADPSASRPEATTTSTGHRRGARDARPD